jgi:two-component system cell cycle sensor histidine kinase/response regulator CckA
MMVCWSVAPDATGGCDRAPSGRMHTSATEYRALLEDLDAIVWEADPRTVQFSFVSQKAERLLGYPIARWLDEPGFWANLIHPDDRDRAVSTCAAAVSRVEDHTFDYRVVAANGRTVWIRDVVHVTADAEGLPSRLRGVMLDITACKCAEDAAVRRDRQCRAIIEHAIDLITFVDAAGDILFESPSAVRLHGFTPAERTGRSIFELIHPDDVANARAAFEAAIRTRGKTPFIELRVRHKDGRWRTFESIGSFVDDGGAPLGIVHSRDVTDRKLLETQFRHAQKMEAIGRLTSSIAHDFNNLLTAILGYTEQLLDAEITLAIGMELREIKRAAEMAAGLTRQLLAFGRRTPPVIQPLDVNAILDEISGLLHRLLGKSATFTLTLAAEEAGIVAGKGMVEQVVINLAVNARDALPPTGGGAIAIRTWNTTLARVGATDESRRYVVIDVADTGGGMSAEVAARLFEPFFTTKEQGKGTGLGLATAYSIVHEAGGWMDVETAEGRGTTVRVHLPVA